MARLRLNSVAYVSYIYFMLAYFKVCKSNLENKFFIKATLWSEIGEKAGVNDICTVHVIVTSLLDSCTLNSSFEVRGLGGCIGWCMLDTQCMAATYTRDVGCMHCLPIEAG